MKGLSLTQLISSGDRILTDMRAEDFRGSLPTYIPCLATVNPDQIAVNIQGVNGLVYSWGNGAIAVPLMSVIKPFILLYFLECFGIDQLRKRVGDLPSALPYNSLEQLELDGGFPRNPMINSGAIALCSHLPGATADQKCSNFSQWLNDYGQTHLFLDQETLLSVQSLPNLINQNLTKKLAENGCLGSAETVAINTYQQLCCLAGNLKELGQLGLGLVRETSVINPEHLAWVRRLMLTGGLYEYSAEFSRLVGWPTKSSVSGLLLSVITAEGAIAIYSPLLDSMGNSVMGMELLKQLASV